MSKIASAFVAGAAVLLIVLGGGHPWHDGNPWHGSAPASGTLTGDGNPWHG